MRHIQANDLDQLVELEKVCFKRPWSKEQLKGSLASAFFVGYIEPEIGYVMMSIAYEDVQLDRFAIVPELRGQGWGRRLLSAVFDDLKLDHCMLEVAESNVVARNLYQSLGFKPLRKIKDYYDAGVDGIVMYLERMSR